MHDGKIKKENLVGFQKWFDNKDAKSPQSEAYEEMSSLHRKSCKSTNKNKARIHSYYSHYLVMLYNHLFHVQTSYLVYH